jgi:hypothetical protein
MLAEGPYGSFKEHLTFTPYDILNERGIYG